MATQAWFESWFDSPYYHVLYADRDQQEAQRFIDKLMTTLDLPKNARLLEEIKELKESSTNQSLPINLNIEEHNQRRDNDEGASQKLGINMRQSNKQLEIKSSTKKGQFHAIVLQRLLKLVIRKAQ